MQCHLAPASFIRDRLSCWLCVLLVPCCCDGLQSVDRVPILSAARLEAAAALWRQNELRERGEGGQFCHSFQTHLLSLSFTDLEKRWNHITKHISGCAQKGQKTKGEFSCTLKRNKPKHWTRRSNPLTVLCLLKVFPFYRHRSELQFFSFSVQKKHCHWKKPSEALMPLFCSFI